MSFFSEDSESVLDSKNKNNEPKTFSQWQNLRRCRPSGIGGYYSTASQMRMMSDRRTLGTEAFYG